ncbi:hypothetical protein M413DRAFT_440413 [Hebeloma cylindrosporum]|uniref:Protein kinase domain-containing protein n=1 Tax=Hebeloma cylindrosporum TaxID=76867 RepID=A0A0C2YAH3_HEBCY|nr:hypothetical protein M413DRAFT_440413 [Hebeloma cylindrosporum h7]
MAATEELVLNAVETVVLHGLCINSDGKSTSLVLSRMSPEPVRPFLFSFLGGSYPPAPASRPSSLPPPGRLQLELTLASKLGSGRVGHVYELDDSKTKLSGPSSSDVFVRPLVVKVGGKNYSPDLAKEAWNYEEMECIQGIAVPLCYGLFQAMLPEDGMQVKPWLDEDHVETATKNSLVSLLVLERVGGHLAMPMMLSDEEKDQIFGVYRELAYLSIAHRDIRYYNILCAPPSPSTPSLYEPKESPFTKRTYNYRLIDFDRARRINLDFKEQAKNDRDWISKIIYGIEHGQILDPTMSQLATMTWSKD